MSNGMDEDLRQVVEEQFTALRKDINKRFNAFNNAFKALTFTLQKNKFLEPEDERFVNSYLEGG